MQVTEASGWTGQDADRLRVWSRDAASVVHRAIDQRITDSGATAHRVAREAFRYLSEFLTLRCAPDILALEVFPDAKELTESMGAYSAVRNHLAAYGWPLNDASIVAVFPGDGATPRTATLFAMRTAWRCISVDPRVNLKARYGEVRRLEVRRERIEAANIEADRVVVVGVHSHAKANEVLAGIQAREYAFVMMPCCVKWQLEPKPDSVIEDFGVLSPQNKILVWRNWRAAA